MMQQINLYNDILQQKQPKSLTSLLPVIFWGLTVFLLAYSGYIAWHINAMRSQIQHAQEALKTEEAAANALLLKIPAQAVNPNLASEVLQWQQNLNELIETIQILNSKNPDDSMGFSQYLQALSNQAIAEVWLTHIAIQGQPKNIMLEGITFKPNKVPEFIHQLRNEPIFKGQSFAKLTMTQATDNPGQINFRLDSNRVASEDKQSAQ